MSEVVGFVELFIVVSIVVTVAYDAPRQCCLRYLWAIEDGLSWARRQKGGLREHWLWVLRKIPAHIKEQRKLEVGQAGRVR